MSVIAMEVGPYEAAGLTKVCEAVCADTTGDVQPDSLYYLRTKIPIGDFMSRLCTYMKCTYETLMTSVILLKRWAESTQQCINRDNFFRALFASTLIAVKVREDNFYTNSYYAMLWGIDITTANRLEEDFLSAINWNIWVATEDYDAFLSGVSEEAAASA